MPGRGLESSAGRADRLTERFCADVEQTLIGLERRLQRAERILSADDARSRAHATLNERLVRRFLNERPAGDDELDRILDRHQFVVDEAAANQDCGPAAALDPEILGTIYERLVARRSESGSYYTPKTIVRRMCRTALARYLATALPGESRDALKRFVERREPDVLRDRAAVSQSLAAVKVCDPACGCGAFLIGMLHELVAMRACLESDGPAGAYRRKNEIIASNLFGVDRDGAAVAIARRRLWLALVTDAGGAHWPPLAELCCNLKEGDSLLEPELFGDAETQGAGFDIVIGNPPYVDSERMTRDDRNYRRRVAESFTTTRGNWDLYVPFWERALQLLGPRGSALLITPNKWLSIPYARTLRKHLQGRVWHVADSASRRAFDGVGVSAVVVGAAREPVETLAVRTLDANGRLGDSVELPGRFTAEHDDWGLLLSEHLGLVLRLLGDRPCVAERFELESPFAVAEAYELQKLLIDDPRPDGAASFRFVNTGTIDPHVSLWGRKPTTYIKRRYEFPTLRRAEFAAAFPRRVGQAESPKLIVSGMRHLEAYYDERGEYVAGKSTVVVRAKDGATDPEVDLVVLSALFNSAAARFIMSERYGSLGIDGGITFTTRNLGRLPWPEFTAAQRTALETLVRRIRAPASADPHAYIAPLLAKIDEIVFAAFSLSSAEAATIRARGARGAKRRHGVAR